VLIAWGMAWYLVSEAMHAPTWRRAVMPGILAVALMVVATAFLWNVKHGET
jgi:hypothetical protein